MLLRLPKILLLREPPGASPGAFFLRKMLYFVVAQRLEYLGATAPLRTVYFALSLLELRKISLKNPLRG